MPKLGWSMSASPVARLTSHASQPRAAISARDIGRKGAVPKRAAQCLRWENRAWVMAWLTAKCADKKDSVDAQQFHFDHQGGVRRDHAAGTARPVGQFRRDGELALAADLHAGHTLVPARDDLAHAELEIERIVAVDAGVEFLAVGEPASVVHRYVLSGAGGVAAAGDEVVDDELAHESVLESEIAMGAQATVLREAAHFLTFPGQRHSAGR